MPKRHNFSHCAGSWAVLTEPLFSTLKAAGEGTSGLQPWQSDNECSDRNRTPAKWRKGTPRFIELYRFDGTSGPHDYKALVNTSTQSVLMPLA